MRWAALIAHVGRRETCTGFWWDNLRKETTGETQALMGDNIKFASSGSGMWVYGLD